MEWIFVRMDGVKLLTEELDRLKRYYVLDLGLPLLAESQDSFTVKAGQSTLAFEQTSDRGQRPFYHFAFDIPENKIDEAVSWLNGRGVHLNLLPNNSHRIYSKSWHATSIYFYDPAENIVELIARHSLANKTDAPFSAEHLLNISEIGLAVKDVPRAMKLLQTNLLIEGYKDHYETFAAVGDEEGLLILSACRRVWLGSNKQAAIFPTEITISEAPGGNYSIEGYPYHIISQL